MIVKQMASPILAVTGITFAPRKGTVATIGAILNKPSKK